ncbi:hypothetical protein DPMN_146428 [Dreissena polymorpha]|uniref:Uncharacterized protein n=1 Tax=Dreissena polymorpha TaxID=45954 RepID=A0A9D4F712_DREPO|nr:hypothetical protein DPMN_146428 [Dreissena polymorpha]
MSGDVQTSVKSTKGLIANTTVPFHTITLPYAQCIERCLRTSSCTFIQYDETRLFVSCTHRPSQRREQGPGR